MASEFQDRNGNYVLQFVGANGRRRSISLGKERKRTRNTVKCHVEELVAAQKANRAPYDETNEWLAEIGVQLHKKLAKAGLVKPRRDVEPVTLAAFLDAYIASRTDIQPNMRRNLINSRGRLVDHFGVNRELSTISPGDADDWRQAVVNEKLADATISKAVKHARHFFRLAERKGLVKRNPFQDLKAGGERNSARLHFVDRATIDTVIAHAPDAQWQLIIALSRYGGLRCPSEHLALRWNNIDWETGKITVLSPKTRRHDKPFRIMPLIPELRPYVEDVRDEVNPGIDVPLSDPVITRYRDTNSNLRTQLLRILRSAGVEPWERLFHNMRASRQTEQADQFPAHVVADWIGNSPKIAERHYLQTTESHFQLALRPEDLHQDLQSVAETPRNDSHANQAALATAGNCDALQHGTSEQAPRAGLEPATLGLEIPCSIQLSYRGSIVSSFYQAAEKPMSRPLSIVGIIPARK